MKRHISKIQQPSKLKKIELINSDLTARILALCKVEQDKISIMATVASELYHDVNGFDWVGFYRVIKPDLLKIGLYQGQHGCLVIPFARVFVERQPETKRLRLLTTLKNSKDISPVLTALD